MIKMDQIERIRKLVLVEGLSRRKAAKKEGVFPPRGPHGVGKRSSAELSTKQTPAAPRAGQGAAGDRRDAS